MLLFQASLAQLSSHQEPRGLTSPMAYQVIGLTYAAGRVEDVGGAFLDARAVTRAATHLTISAASSRAFNGTNTKHRAP